MARIDSQQLFRSDCKVAFTVDFAGLSSNRITTFRLSPQ
jgi:hypothetical protein